MKALLKQLREGIIEAIKSNPVILSMSAYPTKDNGYGENIPDMSKAPVVTVLDRPVRISHIKQVPPERENEDAGPFSIGLSAYILADYLTTITEGSWFTFADQIYKVRRVDTLTAAGGDSYGSRAYLQTLTEEILVD